MNDNLMKKKFPYFIFFVIVFVLSYRFFLSKFIGIGHNWDWTFPALDFLADRITFLSKYTWYNFDLGGQLDLTMSHLIPNYIFAFLSSIFHVKGAVLIIFLLVELVSFFSFKKMLDYLIKKSNINYIPAILFAFSPFLFNEIIGGSWYMWISYAFAPLFFLSLNRFIESRQAKYIIVFLLSAIFVFSSLQNFILLQVIIVFYLTLKIYIKKYSFSNIKSIIARYSFANIIFLFFSSYWIIPFLLLSSNFQKVVSSHEFAGDFSSVKYTEQSIISIFSLVGYLDRNLYYHIIPILSIFFILVFFILILVLITTFFKKNNLNKNNSIIWLLIIIVLILFIKGGQPPFSSFTISFFENFPLMKLYRSPQHLMFAAAFIIPILVAFSLHYFYEKSRYKNVILALFSVAIIFWISGWWVSGDLGSSSLKKQNRDSVDFYSLPPGLIETYSLNEISKLQHRIVFSPSIFSPIYLKNIYQNDGQGGQPEYMYLKNPTLRSETNIFAENVENYFCLKNNFNLINYLSLINVKYLSSRFDILPKFTKCGELNVWDSKKAIEIIDDNSIFKIISKDKYSHLYSIDNQYFLPHFYIPKNNVITDKEVEDLPEIVSDEDWEIRSAVFFEGQNVDKANELENLKVESLKREEEKLPILEFKKINPTKYRVRVHSANGKFPLVFSESFHDGWRAYATQAESEPDPRRSLSSSPIGGEDDKWEDSYKILDGNESDQAIKEDVGKFIEKGWVTDLGDGEEKEVKHMKWNAEKQKEELDYVEKYNIDFISKNFQGTIQNDNLPKGKIWETWMPGSFKVESSLGLKDKILKQVQNDKVVELPEENHLMVNGYANSWLVDVEQICKIKSEKAGGDYCIKNDDGTYDMELTVEFWPQRLFYVGVGVSGLTLLACLGYLGYDFYRRKRNIGVEINNGKKIEGDDGDNKKIKERKQG
jgi:hypothetical protein